MFLDLEDARRRIGLFIDHYNFQRPHQGLGGLTPADRYFEAAPERHLTIGIALGEIDLAAFERAGVARIVEVSRSLIRRQTGKLLEEFTSALANRVSEFGLERARELAAESHHNARAALEQAAPDGAARELEQVTDFVYTRSS